jgi:type IV secretory pathway VirB6-like protein
VRAVIVADADGGSLHPNSAPLMANWVFFGTLYTQILGLVQAGADGILNGALDYARPVVLAAIIAWIAFQAISVANGMAPMRSLWHGVIRAAVVVFLLQAANYNQYVSTVAQAIPTQVTAAISGGGAVAGGAAFDNVWNGAAKAGIAAWKGIPSYSLKGAMLFLLVGVYFIAALACIGAGFLVYLASTILLILLLNVGPLFVAMFAFPQTQKFAAGWVSAVASTIVTQILAVAILVMFTAAELATINKVAEPGVGTDFLDQLFVLLEAVLLLAVIASLVKQAPSIGASVAGGVYQGVGGLLGSTGKMAGLAARGTTGGIAQAARGAGAVASRATSAARVSRPTGKSLSEG